MCQGNGEVTAAHPFCVILQKDRLYFKGTDRAVFLDKREFTGPIYTQIKEAVDLVLRNMDWCEKRNMSYRRKQSGKFCF